MARVTGADVVSAGVSALFGALSGFGAAVVAFRVQLAALSGRHQTLEALRTEDKKQRAEDLENQRRAVEDARRDFGQLCTQLDERRKADRDFIESMVRDAMRSIGRSEQRQQAMIAMMADIARALNVNHRASDVLAARYEDADDDNNSRRGR